MKYTKLSGFSLIEIAFVLLIMGIAASITFPLLTASQKLERYKVTEAHQDQIFLALAGYVLKHDRLPIPSTPELAGKQGTPCNERVEAVYVGIIPYQELGLSESVARDGYGHWFSYVVAKDLTKIDEQSKGTVKISSNIPAYGFCTAPQVTPFTVTSLANLPVLPQKGKKEAEDFIAIVLISHGPKGAGAFQQTTSERLPVEHPLELKNSIADDSFFIRTSQDTDPSFTHEVYWVTRNNLMAIYGKKPCYPKYESTIGNGSGNDGSTGKSSSIPVSTFLPKEMQTGRPLF